MPKCDHEGAAVVELGTAEKAMWIEDGKIVVGDFDARSKYVWEIRCYKCGLNRRYDLHSKSCPAWVKRLDQGRYEGDE